MSNYEKIWLWPVLCDNKSNDNTFAAKAWFWLLRGLKGNPGSRLEDLVDPGVGLRRSLEISLGSDLVCHFLRFLFGHNVLVRRHLMANHPNSQSQTQNDSTCSFLWRSSIVLGSLLKSLFSPTKIICLIACLVIVPIWCFFYEPAHFWVQDIALPLPSKRLGYCSSYGACYIFWCASISWFQVVTKVSK